MELQDFSVLRDNADEVTFTIVPGSGVDLSKSGTTVIWKAYEQDFGVVADDAVAIISKAVGSGIEIIESPQSFKVTIDGADTADLLGNYYHEATVIDSLDNKTTVTQGIMTVTETQE